MPKKIGDGFIFNGNASGDGGYNPFGEDGEEEFEEEHEHVYNEVAQTPNLIAFEEMVHQVITIDFQDRGLTLEFDYEEAEELGQLLTQVLEYLQRKRALDE